MPLLGLPGHPTNAGLSLTVRGCPAGNSSVPDVCLSIPYADAPQYPLLGGLGSSTQPVTVAPGAPTQPTGPLPYMPPIPGFGQRQSDEHGMWEDLEEDLTECIAAWQESGHANANPDFPRVQAPRSPIRPILGSPGLCGLHDTSSGLGPVVSLNVGGQKFKTTATTLRKAPFFDSLLRHAGEGSIGTTRDEDGHIFVDRSGEFFSYLLEFLRSGHWLLGDRSTDLEFVELLREEAEFYGLDCSGDSQALLPKISEYVTIWQFRDDTSLYVDCLEQTVREDPDHQGLFRLCKYSGGLPLDQQTCTKRFKATSHSVQAVMSYFAMRGFHLQHVQENCMITHTTSADGQSRNGLGTQSILSRLTQFPQSSSAVVTCTPPGTQRG